MTSLQGAAEDAVCNAVDCDRAGFEIKWHASEYELRLVASADDN